MNRRAAACTGLAAALLLALLGACGSSGIEVTGENEVDFLLTGARLDLPEPAERWFSGGTGAGTATALRLTENQLDHEPSTRDPTTQGTATPTAKLGVQPVAPVALALVARDPGAPLGQLKLHLLRPDRAETASLALTLAYGKGHEDFEAWRACGSVSGCTPAHARTALDWRTLDVGLVAGRPMGQWWLLYGGPFHTRVEYDGEHYSDRGAAADVSLAFRGTVSMTGLHAGAALRLEDWGRIIGEAGVVAVRAGDFDDVRVTATVANEFHFGSRR